LQLINTLEEKIDLFKEYDIDHLIIQKFDYNFSRISSLEYIRDFLLKKIGLNKLILGYDHHFGRNRESSFDLIKEYSELYNFDIIKVPPFKEDGISISSTKIRNYLALGNISLVNKLLGYKFNFIGTVVKGNGIGASIGFPTANIEVDNINKVIPGLGVYSTYVYIQNIKYLGMLNIGRKPTFGENNLVTIELHILDFNRLIYSEKVQLIILSKLRNEMKFESAENLIAQLQNDELRIRSYFNNLSSD
jgi:riboflavin kinase/FMN adenylyltransferase